MAHSQPGFTARLGIALKAFFQVLGSADFAADLGRLQAGEPPPPAAEPPKPPPLRDTSPDAALQLLGLLQQDGRFIDFLQEDIASFSDADIGAAARVVHEGCSKTLRQHITLEPVRNEDEESRVTLQAGFDAGAIRLTGNVVGQPPFTGRLTHRGWRVSTINLPKVAQGHDLRVIQPAEVEL